MVGDEGFIGKSSGKRTLQRKPQKNSRFYSSVWTFEGEADPIPYRWYGTLPEALVDRLLELYANGDRAIVLDPFMGSGTTPVVARRRGVTSLSLDVNPLSVLTALVRTDPSWEPRELDRAQHRVERRMIDSRFRRQAKARFRGVLSAKSFRYTAKWFRPDTLERVWLLGAAIAQESRGDMQRKLLVALAAAVRDVASVDPRCTHHLVTKNKPYVDPLPIAFRHARSFCSPATTSSAHMEIRQADALSDELGSDYSLSIVHPPYLGVINYHWIHRPATDLLGELQSTYAPSSLRGLNFEHSVIRESDISSDKTDPYLDFIRQFAAKILKAMAVGGRCVVVIGDQRYRGLLRHTFAQFTTCFEEVGFGLEESFVWLLQNNGGMHVLRRGHFIDHNYVLVFRRMP